jgi:hypothetical protein
LDDVRTLYEENDKQFMGMMEAIDKLMERIEPDVQKVAEA